MAEEMIDVVDWLLRFTGTTKPKSQVYNDGDVHVCVHIVVTDGRGNVVEQFRGPDCKLMRLVWDPMSIAGHISAVELDESDPRAQRPDIIPQAIEAGIREGLEEIDLVILQEWFFTKKIRFIGITRTNVLTNEGYDDRWWDRSLTLNFVLTLPEVTHENVTTMFKLEPGKVLAVRLTNVDDLERVLQGESDEPYADRQPDQSWLLATVIDVVRRIAQGY